MIVEAPAMRAPWIALNPSGPHPTTATMELMLTSRQNLRRRAAQARHGDATANHFQIHGEALVKTAPPILRR